MSARRSNLDVSLVAHNPQSPIAVDRHMYQVMDITVNASLGQNVTTSSFAPEASICIPYNGSIAALTAKAYNSGVTSGSITVYPYLPFTSGVPANGAVLTAAQSRIVQMYPKSFLPFSRLDTLHLVYSNTANYIGPSGSSGFRLGLWVWQ